jgi:hypothetical protein
MKHEETLKTNINSIDMGGYGVGDINSYYHHIEAQRGLVDDLHYRVANGGYYGYHYNPYYGAGHYPYASYPYGSVYDQTLAYTNPFYTTTVAGVSDPNATPVGEGEEEELSAGEIAGIVIGSVVGCLLLLLLCALARNTMGRSRAPPQYPMRNMPPSHPDTSVGDITDGPDIMDMSGKPPAGK